MKPVEHLAVSSALGAGVWAASGAPGAVVTAAAAGVLVDADHALDYYLWFVRGSRGRVIYALHGWEYLLPIGALAAASGWHPLIVAAWLGYASHLVGDQLSNHAQPLSYSLAYRALHRFRMADVAEGWRPPARGSLERALPFGQRVVPWLRWLARGLGVGPR